jgi:ABC-type dipeptide/oligopeptide/nickel transport system permease component
VVAGWRRGSRLDSLLPPAFVVTSALPYFWVGLLLILVFSVWTGGLLPSDFNYDSGLQPAFTPAFVFSVFTHALLPAATILIASIGGWILTMRNNMITTLAEDYVRMGRAKGLSDRRIMTAYAARNAMLPNLSGFAMSLGFVIAGAILVEYVFNYPGLGYLLYNAVQNTDYPLMQALFMLFTWPCWSRCWSVTSRSPSSTRGRGSGTGAVDDRAARRLQHADRRTGPAPGRRAVAAVRGSRKAMVGLAIFRRVRRAGRRCRSCSPSVRTPTRWSSSPVSGSSREHLLGTTALGQDIFAQLVYGTRQSLVIALVAGFFATVLSVLVGVSAAYLGGSRTRR